MVEVEVPTDNELEKGLKKSFIGYFKEGHSYRSTMHEVESKAIQGLATSRFDSISCIITKIDGLQVLTMEEKEVESIRACFAKVIP